MNRTRADICILECDAGRTLPMRFATELEWMDPMTDSPIATSFASNRPTRTLTRRTRGIALAVAALLATSTAVAAAAPANAAVSSIKCPSAACVKAVAGVGEPRVAVSEEAGVVYVLYATSGELRKI